MTLYDDIVKITKKYFGFTAEFFVNGILLEMGKEKDTFKKEDVKTFASKIPKHAGRALPHKKTEALVLEILKLA